MHGVIICLVELLRIFQKLLLRVFHKMRTIKAKTPYDLRNKLLRYGLSLGYDFETVREAVDASTPNSPDTFDSCEAFSY